MERAAPISRIEGVRAGTSAQETSNKRLPATETRVRAAHLNHEDEKFTVSVIDVDDPGKGRIPKTIEDHKVWEPTCCAANCI